MFPELKRLIEQMGKDRGIDRDIIVKALEDEDTRRPGYDGLKRMREARATAKRVMKERHDEIEAQIAHALSASSLEEQARRAQEVIQRYGKEG